MRRTKFTAEQKGKLKPVDGSFFMVDKNMVYKHGIEIAMYMTNLLEKHIYFEEKFPQYNGRFFLTYADQAKQLKTTEHLLRKYKQYAKSQGWLITRWKGRPAKEWYDIQLEHPDIQLALKIIKGLAIKNFKALAIKNFKGYKDTKYKDTKYKDIFMEKNNFSNSSNNIASNGDKLISPDKFDTIYKLYPRKGNRPAAKKAFLELCQREDRPTYREIRSKIKQHTKSDAWQNYNVIIKGKAEDMRPGLTKWIQEEMWQVEPKDLPQIYKPKEKDKTNSIGHRDKNADGTYYQHREADITS